MTDPCDELQSQHGSPRIHNFVRHAIESQRGTPGRDQIGVDIPQSTINAPKLLTEISVR